ncbi:MAG: hypothetical protein IKQ33_01775 [Clostridia bacterium]|nr:hypothetical protein [Clostridia bacterium]
MRIDKLKQELKWYVLWHESNRDIIEPYNIFSNARIWDERIGLPKLLNKYITFDDFKNQLERLFKGCFHSRAEYEMMISGLFDFNKTYKIDVWKQIEPNLDLIARYIIETYNKHKRKKIEVTNSGKIKIHSDDCIIDSNVYRM